MEVPNDRIGNSWASSSSSGSEKGLLQASADKQRSSLATQLQQAWLQTQVPKRNVPNSEYISPLPSAPNSPHSFLQLRQQQQQFAPTPSQSSSLSQLSPSFSNTSLSPRQYSPEAFSPAYTTSRSDVGSASSGRQDASEADPPSPMEDDGTLQYLSDMLMDEDLDNQNCMYMQCSAYQAMTEELADLIGDNGRPTLDNYVDPSSVPTTTSRYQEDAVNETAGSSWIAELFRSNPSDFLREEDIGDSNVADEVSSIVSGITNITTGAPPPQTPESAAAPQPGTVAEQLLGYTGSEYDCPYLENDRLVSHVDYTNGRSGIESLAELYPVLMQCAQAVATDNVGEAHQLLNQLRTRVSPFGDGGQRLSFYVVEALVARLSGTGAQLYTALSKTSPSAADMLKWYRLFVHCNPLPRICHMYANKCIMTSVSGHKRVHIIDYGILYGFQWPSFLKKISMREGGPPFVRITGIDVAQPGFHKNVRVEATGRRLALKAKELGIEFEFHAIAGKWEQITIAQLGLREDETLIVNSMLRLRNTFDETVMAASPRKILLSRIHSMKPKLFTMGVSSATYNSPFFMVRFRETVNHFSAIYDCIHSCMPPDNADLRRVAEKEILGREILNIIACEGTERVERAETYRQWQSRSLNAGFKQIPIDPLVFDKAGTFLKDFNSNFGIAVDGHWLLTGWKDRVIHGLTAWVPS